MRNDKEAFEMVDFMGILLGGGIEDGVDGAFKNDKEALEMVDFMGILRGGGIEDGADGAFKNNFRRFEALLSLEVFFVGNVGMGESSDEGERFEKNERQLDALLILGFCVSMLELRLFANG